MLCGAVGAGGREPAPRIRWEAVAWVLLTGISAYALDRVKLRDAWIDPADVHGQPRRYGYLRPRARMVRMLAFAALVSGTVIGMRVTPSAPVAAISAVCGVVCYAPGPRRGRARLKDVHGLKNLYIAAGITGFAVIAAVAGASPIGTVAEMWRVAAAHAAPIACAAALLAVRVAVDAALCDLDDEESDRRFGTATLPVTLGGRRAWIYTGVARAFLALATLVAWPCPWRARVVWATVGVAGIAVLRLRRPERIRDPVDLRLAIEALAATVLLVCWNLVAR